ncbi:MAG: transposase [Myxococcaceae bacterium]
MALRFLLAKDARLFSKVLRLFVRALFAYQRRRARKLGVFAPLPGAVVFLQRFGSALQLTPHVHLVAPDGLFLKDAQGTLHFCPLSPPTDEDVQALLHKVALRTVALLRDAGTLEDVGGESGQK